MAGEAKLRIVAVDDATASLNRVKAGLEGLAMPLRALGGLAGAAGVSSIVTELVRMTGALDDLHDTARGLGVLSQELGAMRTSARLAGVDAGSLDRALTSLNLKIGQAVAGNKEAVALFERFGVAFQEAGRARSTVAVLGDLSDKLRTFRNDANRATVEAEFFGQKLGPKLAAYLDQGSTGLQRYSGITEDLVQQSVKLQDELDKAAVGFERMKLEILSGVLPQVNRFIEGAQRLIDQGTALREVWGSGLWGAISRAADQAERARQAANFKPVTDKDTGLPVFIRPQDQFGGQSAPLGEDPAVIAARNKRIQEAAEALREFKKESLKAKLEEDEVAARRAAATLEHYNRSLQEGIDAQEGYKRAGLDEYHRREAQDAARARATLDEYNRKAEESARVTQDLGVVFQSAISELIRGGEELTARSFFKSLGQDLAQVGLQILVLEPLIVRLREALRSLQSSGSGGGFAGLFSAIGGWFGGARAEGGPVSSGRPYLVGERGPELFVPQMSGQVVAAGGFGGVTVSMVQNIDARSDISTIRAMGAQLEQRTLRAVRDQLARRGPISRV